MVYRFDLTDATSERRVSQLIAAAVRGWGQASIDFQRSIGELTRENNVLVTSHIRLSGVNPGSWTLPDPEDPAALMLFARDLPQLIQATGSVGNQLSFELAEYPIKPDDAEYDAQRDAIDELADHYRRAINLRTALQYYEDHHAEFSPSAAGVNWPSIAALDRSMRAIVLRAERCGRPNATSCSAGGVGAPDIEPPERLRWTHINQRSPIWQDVDDLPRGRIGILEAQGGYSCTSSPGCRRMLIEQARWRVVNPDTGLSSPILDFNGRSARIEGYYGRVQICVPQGDGDHEPFERTRAALWTVPSPASNQTLATALAPVITTNNCG